MIVESIPFVKANGRCIFCNAKLKIKERDYNLIKTRGYTKYYGDEEAVIKCPKCKREQAINLA